MDDYLSATLDYTRADVTSAVDELSLWSAMFGNLMLKHLPMRHGMIVLDVGYGTGFPLLELAERLGASCKVYGVDPWEAACERALEKARVWQVSNVEALLGDAAALSFPDGMFDLIVSNLGLNNFADPRAAIRECARAAKPGGRLALTTNLQGHMGEFYDVYEATLHEMGLDMVIPALREHIAHRATVAGVKALMEPAGFRLRTVQEERQALRFVDGSAMLRHHFIRLGFLDAWKELIEPEKQRAFFERLEANLNRAAGEKGELDLSIPMAYIEGERV